MRTRSVSGPLRRTEDSVSGSRVFLWSVSSEAEPLPLPDSRLLLTFSNVTDKLVKNLEAVQVRMFGEAAGSSASL